MAHGQQRLSGTGALNAPYYLGRLAPQGGIAVTAVLSETTRDRLGMNAKSD